MTQEQIYSEFCTMVEETVLDPICGHYKMDWEDFIDKIRNGWNPEVGENGMTHCKPTDHLLNCYRTAWHSLHPSNSQLARERDYDGRIGGD